MTLFLLLGYGLAAAIALAKYMYDRRRPATDYALTPSRIKMRPGQTAILRIVPLDKDGNVTVFDTGVVPQWTPPDASAGVSTLMDPLTVSFVAGPAGADVFTTSVTLDGVPIVKNSTVVVAAGPATDYRVDVTLPQN